MSSNKKSIIVVQGHLYSFWSTGIYYTTELAVKYNIVLLVPENYRHDNKFLEVCDHLHITDINYYRYCGNNPAQHFINYRYFKMFLLAKKPAFIIQHDYIGTDNMYIFHLTKKHLPACLRIVILSSFPSNENTSEFNKQFIEMSINRYSSKLKISPFLMAIFWKATVYCRSIWHNKFLPAICLREIPYFPLSLFHNIDIIPKKPLYDYYFFYDACEKKHMDWLFSDANMSNKNSHQVISCPILDKYHINRFLYGEDDLVEEKILYISPSLLGFRDFDEEETTLNKWVCALKLLRDRLPDYKFIIKFHPGFKSNRMKIIQSYLKKHCPFLQVYDSWRRAEALILRSKIIVGDVSTILWWANFKGNKVVISLGMQDFEGSGDMRYYPDILYFENMSDLSKLDVPVLVAEQVKKIPQNNHPLLTDVLELI